DLSKSHVVPGFLALYEPRSARKSDWLSPDDYGAGPRNYRPFLTDSPHGPVARFGFKRKLSTLRAAIQAIFLPGFPQVYRAYRARRQRVVPDRSARCSQGSSPASRKIAVTN